MSNIVEEFLKSLEPDREEFEAAIVLLILCRTYLENHYKRSVYGEYQKSILNMLDEFLERVKKKWWSKYLNTVLGLA